MRDELNFERPIHDEYLHKAPRLPKEVIVAATGHHGRHPLLGSIHGQVFPLGFRGMDTICSLFKTLLKPLSNACNGAFAAAAFNKRYNMILERNVESFLRRPSG